MSFHYIEEDPRFEEAKEILEEGYVFLRVGVFGYIVAFGILIFTKDVFLTGAALLVAWACLFVSVRQRDKARKILNSIPKRGENDRGPSEGGKAN